MSLAVSLGACSNAPGAPVQHIVGPTTHDGWNPAITRQHIDTPWQTTTHGPANNPSSPTAARRHRPKGGGTYKVGRPYVIHGSTYTPSAQPSYDETGVASWYGDDFDGKRTANGETYDMYALTAAHRTLPMPSYAYVTNLANNRTILVRINDRGPFKKERLIDLSLHAAKELGFERAGTQQVRVRYVGRAPLNGDDSKERAFLEKQLWSRKASR